MRLLRWISRRWYLRGAARRATVMQRYREEQPSPTVAEFRDAQKLYDYWKEHE